MKTIQESSTDIFAIHTAFAATEYGEALAANIRYEKYNLTHLPNEEWVGLLGADVNNLTHMPLTYGLATSFIRETERVEPGSFGEADQTLLKVAAIGSDISFGDKTEADEAEEKVQFERNVEAFCPGASVAIKKLIVQARDEVVFDSTTRVGLVFNAIERTGYVRTALRASGHIQADTAGEAEPGFRWIVADVLSNQPPKLIDYAGDYPAVNNYLTNQSGAITTAFGLVEPQDFENYGANQHAKEAQFNEAHTTWHRWLHRVVETT
jgi:hypothetical protein